MVFREPHTPGSKTPGGRRNTVDGNGPRNSFAPASSSAAMRRSSSVFGASNLYASTAFKDKRNLQAPQNKQAMIQKIVTFLNGEASAEEVKQPTRRKFLEIFEYIYQSLDDSYCIDYKKSQDEQNAEVIKVFKNMGYPVTIKNSTMQSLNAPNSWPHLLGALTWMIELVEFFNKITLEQFMNSSEDSAILRYQADAAISRKVLELGMEKLSEDEKNQRIKEIIDEQVVKFKARLEASHDLDSKMQESTLRCRELEKEIEALEREKQSDRCPLLQDEIKTIQGDIENVENYIVEARKIEEKCKRDAESERRLISELDTKLADVNADIKTKQRLIEEQTQRTGLDSAAIRALAMEKESLSEQIKQLTEELEKYSKFKYNLAPKANSAFIQEQAKYRRLVQRVYNVRATHLGDSTTPLIDSIPEDIKSLLDSLSTDVRRLFSRTKTELESRLHDIEADTRRLASDERRLMEEDSRVDKENRAEEMAMEKEDRARALEREDWSRESNLKEREKQAAEVEKDIILGSHKEIGQLNQQIHEAELDLNEAKSQCQRKKVEFDQKLEERVFIHAENIENINQRKQFIEGEMCKLEKFNESRAQMFAKK